MATGFIGTSTASSSNIQPITGTSLSYICPASGVRYAVITITARIQANVLQPVFYQCKAGQLQWGPYYTTSVNDLYKESIYTVILGPGQGWTDYTFTPTTSQGVNTLTATLTASVLEVV